MNFTMGDPDKRWDIASQVKESVQLYSTFRFSEKGPWKNRQA